MLKNILFCLLLIIFSFNLMAVSYDEDIQDKILKFQIPLGDPNKTIIIAKNKNYLILHNPQAFAFETIKRQASYICGEINNDKNIGVTYSSILGVYTAYFVCGKGKSVSLDEKKVRENFLEKDFIYSLRQQYYDQINQEETNAEKNRIKNKIKKISETNVNICLGHGYTKDTNIYNECLMKLIEKIEWYLWIFKK